MADGVCAHCADESPSRPYCLACANTLAAHYAAEFRAAYSLCESLLTALRLAHAWAGKAAQDYADMDALIFARGEAHMALMEAAARRAEQRMLPMADARIQLPRLATGEIDSAQFSGVTCYWDHDDGTTPSWCERCWSLIPAGAKGFVYGWPSVRCRACRLDDFRRETQEASAPRANNPTT